MKNDHHDEIFDPEDPRLTAYALGELEGEERSAVEARLTRDAAARATVAAVRALAGEMSSALAAEPTFEGERAGEPLQRAAIIPGSDLGKLDGGSFWPGGPIIRFPQFYYVISGLAAACFVVFVATRAPEAPKAKPKQYTEFALNPGVLPVALPVAEAEAELPLPAATSAAEPVARFAGGLAAAPEESRSLLRIGEPAGIPIFLPRQERDAAAWYFDRRAEPVGKIAAQSVVFQQSPVPLPLLPRRVATAVPGNPFGGASLAANSDAYFSTREAGVFNFSFAAPLLPQRGGLATFGWRGVGPTGEVRATPALISQLTAELHRTQTAENYAYIRDNDFLSAAQNPLSTFSLDVDTASYANVRRYLKNGMRPPADAVRIEELINYFPYRYTPPAAATGRGEVTAPIAAMLEVAAAPWAESHRLVRILFKSREVTLAARAPANLVFLIDVSGSMSPENRLPLVKESLRLLVGKLRPDDRVAIVTYAGNSGLALPSTPVAQAREIVTALDGLTAGGSTNGEMGIHLAYDIAKAHFVTGGVNRVILCTDGDFNVGVTNSDQLTRLVAEKAKTGVFLTTLGFGMGNLKDAMLEKLADNGNGNYGYIDTRREAEKLLVDQVNGTLVTVAKDVKIQVDFNPARVASYRLIGYENRLLKKEDFNDDQVDAGEIGAGHTVTALYEIVPVGAETGATTGVRSVDESKYAPVAAPRTPGSVPSGELLTVRVRYKEPADDVSRKLEFPLTDRGTAFADATPDFKFAAAVASFGMILRDSPHKGSATLDQVASWAAAGIVDDAGGWRGEFIELARMAKTL